MNEELTKKLLEWINNIESFAKDQIPDLAEQLIKWRIYKSIMLMILFTLVIIFFIKTARFLHKKSQQIKKENETKDIFKKSYDSGEGSFAGCICCYTAALVFFVSFSDELMMLVKAIVCPKIYLLEYFYHR